MSITVNLRGMRWAVDACQDDRGTYYKGRAWTADRPDLELVYLAVYFGGRAYARDAIRKRLLVLFGHDPSATLENELGETISPGG